MGIKINNEVERLGSEEKSFNYYRVIEPTGISTIQLNRICCSNNGELEQMKTIKRESHDKISLHSARAILRDYVVGWSPCDACSWEYHEGEEHECIYDFEARVAKIRWEKEHGWSY